MAIYWRYFLADGVTRGESARFDDREEAEAWLGQNWPSLADEGMVEVALIDGDRELYRMPLDADA